MDKIYLREYVGLIIQLSISIKILIIMAISKLATRCASAEFPKLILYEIGHVNLLFQGHIK